MIAQKRENSVLNKATFFGVAGSYAEESQW